MKNKFLSVVSAFYLAFTAMNVQADMITDAHGNVGYDTAAECDAAVSNGTAKFYQPFTHKKPLLREGEKGVQHAKLSDLGEEYKLGACDLGVGHKLGRDGVSVALQGKYVPYSPDMPINAYTDNNGEVVRVTMGQCDNWFSDNSPRAVEIAKAPEPVVTEEPTPVAEAPVETPAPVKAAAITPYVFGTLGVLHDGVRLDDEAIIRKKMKDDDTRFAGQIGAGVQFNDLLGAEIFYQGARKNYYQDFICAINRTFGARATLGKNFTDNTRLFAKVGAAGVRHEDSEILGKGKWVARPTAGVGVTHKFTNNWAVRADYDHVFKLNDAKRAKNSGAKWQGSHYLGAGIQYNF